jgi:endonuclease YncB( thermonuclease family)
MIGWRDGVLAATFAAGLAAMGQGPCDAAQERPPAAIACGGEILGRGVVSRIVDGRTLMLDDGREVRLAAVEIPLGALELGAAGNASAGAALATLLGSEVVLRQGDAQKTDRYGRAVAFVFTERAGLERLVQGDLIDGGQARVAARVGSRGCAVELLAREAAARSAKLGLWASSYYDTRDAGNPADVLAARGRFALVEGRVVSVRESGATIYVNFGRRWTEDFTVTILKRNARSFVAAGLEPKTLAGRRIRVRGWVEERGGPWIEASRPEQIEITDRK